MIPIYKNKFLIIWELQFASISPFFFTEKILLLLAADSAAGQSSLEGQLWGNITGENTHLGPVT